MLEAWQFYLEGEIREGVEGYNIENSIKGFPLRRIYARGMSEVKV